MIRNLLLIVFRYPEVQDEAKAFSVAVTKEHSSRVGRHLWLRGKKKGKACNIRTLHDSQAIATSMQFAGEYLDVHNQKWRELGMCSDLWKIKVLSNVMNLFGAGKQVHPYWIISSIIWSSTFLLISEKIEIRCLVHTAYFMLIDKHIWHCYFRVSCHTSGRSHSSTWRGMDQSVTNILLSASHLHMGLFALPLDGQHIS